MSTPSEYDEGQAKLKELRDWLLQESTNFKRIGSTKFERCVDGDKWPYVLAVLSAFRLKPTRAVVIRINGKEGDTVPENTILDNTDPEGLHENRGQPLISQPSERMFIPIHIIDGQPKINNELASIGVFVKAKAPRIEPAMDILVLEF